MTGTRGDVFSSRRRLAPSKTGTTLILLDTLPVMVIIPNVMVTVPTRMY